ncbi:MAG: hypothetical protein IIC13_18840 [SAR324 cluster bacterium]|nr:hypothetical protein [SAR324 cluster bacterium]
MELQLAEKLLKLIEGRIFHTTTGSAFIKIIDDGSIKPNDGEYPNRFPQSASSISHHFGFISLFDFTGFTLDNILEDESLKWLHFFMDQTPLNIAIQLNRDFLESKLVRFEDLIENDISTTWLIQPRMNADKRRFVKNCISRPNIQTLMCIIDK